MNEHNEHIETREDVVWPLARNLVRATFEHLSGPVVEATKRSILDTLGVMVAASGVTPGLKELVELVKEGGGSKESSILGFGGKAPAWMAAFANGAMAHCLDYDDFHYAIKAHASANTVPAGFAVAERLGKVSGRDFIAAIVLGNDLFSRLGFSVTLMKFMWHQTPLFGVFAAAATSARLLRLSEKQTVDALGLAFCQAAGTQELRFGVDSEIGGMRDGFTNQAGVTAALLAQRGIRGVRTCFEGKAGFYNVYYQGDYNREALTAGLGTKFHGEDIGFKPWPACAGAIPYIDAALSLVNEHDIRPGDVEKITVFVGDFGQTLCEPLEARRRPAATLDAKFSIPFSTAVAIARRKVTIQDFSPAGLEDPLVLELAQKVEPVFDDEYSESRERKPGKVAIRTKDGQVCSKRTDFPYGHHLNPVSKEDLVDKFRDCLRYSARPVPQENVEKAIALIDKLEGLPDVGRVIRLLGPGRTCQS